MKLISTFLFASRTLTCLVAAAGILLLAPFVPAQTSNVTVRIMAANLNGDTQSIQPFAINIFKGLKPDVVCIQEFNYNNNTAADFRALVDNAFGTNYSYYRESGSLQIPNGIISRYPIIAAGRWVDTQVSNRGFAWARLDLPGSNDLYAVSVHFLTTSSAKRATEANNLKALILSNFPANAWLVIGGDFNADSRGETCVTTFASLCPDAPIPTDAETGGEPDTNANRNKPYDYVLASHSLTNYQTNVVFTTRSFPKGLVFDSRVYTPLSDVSPVVYGDSGQGQHMGVLKDFFIPVSGSNSPVAPFISGQPQPQIVPMGSNAAFTVTATGTAPLAYQWRFNGTNISGALTNTYNLVSAQVTNNGDYTVIITNIAGSATSSVATLIVSNIAPTIATNPASLDVFIGDTVAFGVTAVGTAPLTYQWQFNGTNLSGATNEDYSFNNAQINHAGNYTVLVTNNWGSATSAPALLTVTNAPAAVTGTNVVISQIYGGGGNSGASYQNDFVELFNPTASAISLAGWTVQYANVTGNSWSQAALSGVLQPYRYYLVQLGSSGAIGSSLPTADATGGANISATQGKLALVQTNSSLSGTNPLPNALIADFVGYGATASAYEGSNPVSTISGNTNSLLRKAGGLTDTDNNGDDFVTLSPPAPRNSASPANPPPTNPPAIAPTLGTPLLVGDQFISQITGTVASNYIVQTTTNLATTNWLNLQTNAAPFWFTNPANQPQQFYRGTLAP